MGGEPKSNRLLRTDSGHRRSPKGWAVVAEGLIVDMLLCLLLMLDDKR